LAVIPARGGSKGLANKNILPLAGMPLIAHSIECARRCPEIDRCIISTDSETIAGIARAHGGDVPFLRPAELARDDSPAIPVLQHALREMERREQRHYAALLLLQPTCPGRFPEDICRAVAMLEEDERCVGVVSVSEVGFTPRWNCVEERNGYLAMSFSQDKEYVRRQDVPPVFRVNGTLYLWRRDYLLHAPLDPVASGDLHRMLQVPEERGFDIDTARDLRMAEIMLNEKLVQLPWLDTSARAPLATGE
jgi:N-acylneuraminate cytidylyltransferase